MLEIYGPDKVGSYVDEAFKKLVEEINQEIAESDSSSISLNMSEENYKYHNKLERLYQKAGWDSVDFNFDYDNDWEYRSIKMTLRKYED